jgi:hypothetical protein
MLGLVLNLSDGRKCLVTGSYELSIEALGSTRISWLAEKLLGSEEVY